LSDLQIKVYIKLRYLLTLTNIGGVYIWRFWSNPPIAPK